MTNTHRSVCWSLATLYVFLKMCFWASAFAGDKILAVEVQGLRNDEGQVYCSLHRVKETFPSDAQNALKATKVRPKDHQALCVFEAVEAGEYAVSVFHDENGNGKLDTNFLGIPSEGVGASNDAKGHFGPPHFEDARFKFSGGSVKILIHMAYL